MGLREEVWPQRATKENGWGRISRLRLGGDWLPVTLGHLLLTTLFTWPLALNLGTLLPGTLLEDRDQNIWNLWWVKTALLSGHEPYHSDYIYYPDGVSLLFHTLHPLNAVLTLPVQLLFGVVAAYNAVVLLSFTLTGLGAYLLIRYVTGAQTIPQRLAVFVGSVIFAFAPWHIATLCGLMQLISLEWVPFYLYFFLKAIWWREEHKELNPLAPFSKKEGGNGRLRFSRRSLEGKGSRLATVVLGLGSISRRGFGSILLAAFFLLLNALTDWYYTLFLMMVSAAVLLYRAATIVVQKPNERAARARLVVEQWLRAAVVLGLFGLVASPVLVAMFGELSTNTYMNPVRDDAVRYSADLYAFFVPPRLSLLDGGLSKALLPKPGYLSGLSDTQVFLGYAALLLGVIGVFARPRRVAFWVALFAVFNILALGPVLHLNGTRTAFGLPFNLISNLPVVRLTRSPDRFNIIAQIGLAVCATYGLLWLLERVRVGRWVLALPLVALALVVGEYLQIPYPMHAADRSEFFVALGKAQPRGTLSVITLPSQGGFWNGAPRMADQTAHHQYIFGGYISREYDHPFERSTPGFQEFVSLKENADIWHNDPVGGSAAAQPQQSTAPTCRANLPLPPYPSTATAPPTAQHRWYDAFAYYKVGYIVLYRPRTVNQQRTDIGKVRTMIGRELTGDAPLTPICQDELIEAYAVPSLPQGDTPRPFLQIGTGWYDPESGTVKDVAHRWAKETQANLTALSSAARATTLRVKVAALEGGHTLVLKLNGAEVWRGIVGGLQEIDVALKLPAGESELRFEYDGTPRTPKSLNMGDDPRPLGFLIQDAWLQ